MSQIKNTIKGVYQLGWQKTSLFMWYQFQLRVGIFNRETPISSPTTAQTTFQPPFNLPDKQIIQATLGEEINSLTQQAQEIINTKVRLFGNDPILLELIPRGPQKHWTQHNGSQANQRDIKLTWEPARFGWATVLARAYYLTGTEKYAHTFWRLCQQFDAYNPTNIGPNWASAQEVGLRLINLSYVYTLVKKSAHTTPWRKRTIINLLADHAARIPPTLSYARAQNNNHLLSEAAALYTAATVLPNHPAAKKWRRLGWNWFHKAIQSQIADDGSYIQHSTNYHRLILQLALWIKLLADTNGDEFPNKTNTQLAVAAHWLHNLTDPQSGLSINLGHNDGAMILPLTTKPFTDTRPVAQAAMQAFGGHPASKDNELAIWLAPKLTKKQHNPPLQLGIIEQPQTKSWGILRVVNFTDRPAHADLLNFSLMLRGQPITLDPGTYMYNTNPPWDNALMSTAVHNTVTINGKDQMTRASRFLWLDWPKSEIIAQSDRSITAKHDSYQPAIHQRTVRTEDHIWIIEDQINGSDKKKNTARLHWLLPNWKFTIEQNTSDKDYTIKLQSPHGPIILKLTCTSQANFNIARAGKLLEGEGVCPPVRGWYSPRYAYKEPALSIVLEVEPAKLPISFSSEFILPS